MSTYDMYYPKDDRSVVVIVGKGRFTYSILTKDQVKASINYLSSLPIQSGRPILGPKIATFKDWDELVTNYPEIFL
jgi:hypothetical protein